MIIRELKMELYSNMSQVSLSNLQFKSNGTDEQPMHREFNGRAMHTLCDEGQCWWLKDQSAAAVQ